TGVTTGWSFFFDPVGRHTVVSLDILPAALEINNCNLLKKRSCWCIEWFINGRLRKSTNIIECRRFEKVMGNKEETNGIAFHATIPLQSGNEQFGLLNVSAPEKREFTANELALLESIALQIGSAIKRIRLTKKEQEIALIDERNRLARDLHDSVNQL